MARFLLGRTWQSLILLLLVSLIGGGAPSNQVVRGPMSIVERASVAAPRVR